MAAALRTTKQAHRDAVRKPLARYGAMEGALARGLLRRGPNSTWLLKSYRLLCNQERRSQAQLSINAASCVANSGSLINVS